MYFIRYARIKKLFMEMLLTKFFRLIFFFFFAECDKMGILNKVLNLNLNKLEEEEFISYLNKCSHNKPAADDLKVLYFLNRRK